MTDTPSITEAERRARATLPIIRTLVGYLPMQITNWLFSSTLSNLKLPDSITRQSVTANGVACDWLIPQGSPSDRVLLYLHGGAFYIGASATHFQMVATLAQRMNIRALMVDYRLAPQHPFPAALDDCVRVYRWLLSEGFPAENIVIAGDSAGGNLTLTSLLQLRDAGEPLPAAAVALSPVGDLTDEKTAFADQHDEVLHPRVGQRMATAYVANHDPRNPLISPVFGEWHKIPPLLIHAGEAEVLCADARRLEARARAAGVDVRLEVYPRMWHVWHVTPNLPQTEQALTDIVDFLTAHLAPA